MNVTRQNHNQVIDSAIVNRFPKDLKEAYQFFQDFGDLYEDDSDIAETIDLYLKQAAKYLADRRAVAPAAKKSAPRKKPTKTKRKSPAKTVTYDAGDIVEWTEGTRKGELAKVAAQSGSQLSVVTQSCQVIEDPVSHFKKSRRSFDVKSTEKKTKAQRGAAPKKTASKKRGTAKRTTAARRPGKKKTAKRQPKENTRVKKVEQLSAEVKILRRAKNLHNKTIDKASLARFLKALQRMLIRKEIRKTSKYAGVINDLQNLAVNFHNGMRGAEKFSYPDTLYAKILDATDDERVLESVKLINSYIGLVNSDKFDSMKRLIKRIEKAKDGGKVTSTDPNYRHLNTIYKKLKSTVANRKLLAATRQQLSGLADVLAKYDMGLISPVAMAREGKKKSLAGIDQQAFSAAAASPPTMHGIDTRRGDARRGNTRQGFTSARNIEQVTVTDTFQLPGDLGEMLGQLERFKTAITIDGEQGSGKTRFTYQLANAFASTGMDVGYFSLEMGHKSTVVRDMINEYVSEKNDERVFFKGEVDGGLDEILTYANDFDVIFIDSWDELHATRHDFREMRNNYPDTIFVVIFPVRDDGMIRGGSATLHIADVNLKAVKSKTGNFRENYVYATKNRYGLSQRKYNVYAQQFVAESEAAQNA